MTQIKQRKGNISLQQMKDHYYRLQDFTEILVEFLFAHMRRTESDTRLSLIRDSATSKNCSSPFPLLGALRAQVPSNMSPMAENILCNAGCYFASHANIAKSESHLTKL